MDSNLLSKMKLKDESQTEGFESLSYGFESLIGAKFKFYKGDSIIPVIYYQGLNGNFILLYKNSGFNSYNFKF